MTDDGVIVIEQALLGIALEDVESRPEILSAGFTSASFTSDYRRLLWNATQAAFEEGENLSILGIVDGLVAKSTPEETRLIKAEAMECIAAAPLGRSPEAAVADLARIIEHRTAEELVGTIAAIAEDRRGSRPLARILEACERANDRQPRASEHDGDLMSLLRELLDPNRRCSRVKFGVRALDCIESGLGGLVPGSLLYLGGVQGGGKTSFLEHIVRRFVGHGGKAALISCEQSAEYLLADILAAELGLPQRRILESQLTTAEHESVLDATERLNPALRIYSPAAVNVNSIRALAARAVRRHDVKLIAVDYLQLIAVDGVHTEIDQINRSSKALKSLARDLGVVVVCAMQLNRDANKANDTPPTLQAGRGSSAIESDCDAMITLWNHRRDGEKATVDVTFQKNRTGGLPADGLTYRWDMATRRFEEDEA